MAGRRCRALVAAPVAGESADVPGRARLTAAVAERRQPPRDRAAGGRERGEQRPWNRRYDPWAIAQDKAIKAGLEGRGILARSLMAASAASPGKCYAAGRRALQGVHALLARLGELGAVARAPAARRHRSASRSRPTQAALAALALLPTTPDWAGGLRETWEPGEAAAGAELDEFRRGPGRRLQGRRATSRPRPACRACRRGCTMASCRRARSGTAPGRPRAAERSCASWSGASSPTTCCSTSRTCPTRRCGRSSPASPGPTMPGLFRAWSAAGPAIPWSTPACASSGTPATCTTGCG